MKTGEERGRDTVDRDKERQDEQMEIENKAEARTVVDKQK